MRSGLVGRLGPLASADRRHPRLEALLLLRRHDAPGFDGGDQVIGDVAVLAAQGLGYGVLAHSEQAGEAGLRQADLPHTPLPRVKLIHGLGR